jgi:CBS domain-containing protein
MQITNILPVARERLITIQADALLTEAATLLCGKHRALLVVCDRKGIMAGIITRTEIVRQVSRCPGVLSDVRAVDVMNAVVTSCKLGDSLHDVLTLMQRLDFVHIPIVDQESRPCGVVNARDALKALLGEVVNEEQLLRAYVMGVGYR